MENTVGQNAGVQADSKFKSYIKLFRPKQWIKNLFVFAALVFSNNILHAQLLEKTLLCFVLFCAASSSVYILNDMIDASKDRLHPKKRFRPIASGAISKTEALVLLIVLVPAVLIGSFAFSKLLFLIYWFILQTTFYTALYLKTLLLLM
jgi:4-hydroxybenzoate polyprenyltransferase